jgi:hypothetical protein
MQEEPKVNEVKYEFTDQFEELEKTDTMLDKQYDCPICFSILQRVGRCETCPNCGWSSCSL